MIWPRGKEEREERYRTDIILIAECSIKAFISLPLPLKMLVESYMACSFLIKGLTPSLGQLILSERKKS